MKHKILNSFETYKEVISATNNDLQYWQPFLKQSIKDYINYPNSTELFSSIFVAYNINPDKTDGFLKTHSKVYRINVNDMERNRMSFFTWVLNLTIIKVYNAMEIFLLDAIQLKYFPQSVIPSKNKKAQEHIQKEIIKYLTTKGIQYDKKNNRYIIQFLKAKSSVINSFLIDDARVDLKTTWENIFELNSILRNAIAHNGMIVNRDTLNEIKSKAKDIFKRHFDLPKDKVDYLNLVPNEGQFLNYIAINTDFALNIVKLIFNKQNLTLFEMY